MGLYTGNVVRVPSLTGGRAASYRISLVRLGEGSDAFWQAEVDDLPECSARGASPEEAMQRAWTAVRASLGEDAPSKPAPRHSGKLLVRMPATLHDELAHAAEAEGVSLNQLITGVLASAVEWRSSDGRARATSASGGPTSDERRVTRLVLAANIAVVSLAAILAIVLLVAAWRAGF
jgi:predicted RNase H-like HicB family nuclease